MPRPFCAISGRGVKPLLQCSDTDQAGSLVRQLPDWTADQEYQSTIAPRCGPLPDRSGSSSRSGSYPWKTSDQGLILVMVCVWGQ
jgi:hypothetical protein